MLSFACETHYFDYPRDFSFRDKLAGKSTPTFGALRMDVLECWKYRKANKFSVSENPRVMHEQLHPLCGAAFTPEE